MGRLSEYSPEDQAIFRCEKRGPIIAHNPRVFIEIEPEIWQEITPTLVAYPWLGSFFQEIEMDLALLDKQDLWSSGSPDSMFNWLALDHWMKENGLMQWSKA